jgi:hypothetical protein
LENPNRAQRYKIILKRQHFKSKKSLNYFISYFGVKKTPEKQQKGGVVSRQAYPFPNLYNNTRILTYVSKKRVLPLSVHLMMSAFACGPSIEDFGIFSEKGWSSDFPPPRSAFSSKRAMAFLLRAIMEFTAAGQSGIHTPVPN